MSKRKEIYKLTKLKNDNYNPILRARLFLKDFTVNNKQYTEAHIHSTCSGIDITFRGHYSINAVSVGASWDKRNGYPSWQNISQYELSKEVDKIIETIRAGRIPEWLGHLRDCSFVLV